MMERRKLDKGYQLEIMDKYLLVNKKVWIARYWYKVLLLTETKLIYLRIGSQKLISVSYLVV